MTDALALTAAVAALATLITVLFLLRRNIDTPTDLAVVPPAELAEPSAGTRVVELSEGLAFEIEPVESAGDVGRTYEISRPEDGDRLAILELLAEPPARADTSIQPRWLSGATLEAFGRIPETAGQLRTARGMRVTFSPQAMRNLRSGQWSLLTRTDGSTMSTLVDASGKVREQGTLIRGIGSAATGALLLATVGASVAVYAQQQWIEQTLRSIESKLSGVLERLQDTDHGRVEGAWAVADQVDRLLNERRDPAALLTELAVARRDVDAVYFSRRRYLTRITDRLGPELAEAIGRETPPKLSRAVKEALGGDAAAFEAEAVLFLEAAVVRARLATTLAHALSARGDIADAMDIVETIRESLYEDLTAHALTFRGLSRWEMGLLGELRGHDDLLDVLKKIVTITDDELLPRLTASQDPAVIEISTETDGDWAISGA